MSILMAVHHFPPHYTGGAEQRAYRTAMALKDRGYKVRVVSVERIDAQPEVGLYGDPSEGVAWKDDLYEGVQVRRLYFNRQAMPDLAKAEYNNPWIGRHLESLIRSQRPDVFHLIGGYLISGSGLRSAQGLKVPTVVTLTDFWFLCPRINLLRSNGELSTLPINPVRCARCLGEERRRFRLPGRVAPYLANLYWRTQIDAVQRIEDRQKFLCDTLNNTCAIISPSQFLRQAYIQSGINAERILFSRQGRDFPGLESETLAKMPSGVLRVGYLGQITPIKGVHVLVKAVKRLPGKPIVVNIYGNEAPFPKYTARLRKLAADDPRIHLNGFYPNNELSRLMPDLDVLVVPSLWYENSPNVILEAFAHRTPVVASDLGGMAELVRHGENGLLFKPGDDLDLAYQLNRLLDEPGLQAHLNQGIEPVKNTADEMDELEKIYQWAVKHKNDAAGYAPPYTEFTG